MEGGSSGAAFSFAVSIEPIEVCLLQVGKRYGVRGVFRQRTIRLEFPSLNVKGNLALPELAPVNVVALLRRFKVASILIDCSEAAISKGW